MHHHRISTMQGVRKGNLIPPEDNLLDQLHKSKHRARVFGQFCIFNVEILVVRDFRIQQDNEKLLRKLTEIAEGKLVFYQEN